MNRHRLAGLMDRLMHKMNTLMHKMNRHMGHRYTDTQNGHSNGWMDRLMPKADRHIGWTGRQTYRTDIWRMARQTDALNGKGTGRGQIQMDRHPDLLGHRQTGAQDKWTGKQADIYQITNWPAVPWVTLDLAQLN